MSAKDYVVCPGCRERARSGQEASKLKASSKYGKVPEREYQVLLAAANAPIGDLPATLRLDYEFGLSDTGETFAINYEAYCSVCGYHVRVRHAEKVKQVSSV